MKHKIFCSTFITRILQKIEINEPKKHKKSSSCKYKCQQTKHTDNQNKIENIIIQL